MIRGLWKNGSGLGEHRDWVGGEAGGGIQTPGKPAKGPVSAGKPALTAEMGWLPEQKGDAGQHLGINSGLLLKGAVPFAWNVSSLFPAHLCWTQLL